MTNKNTYTDKSSRAKVSGKRMTIPRTHKNCTEVYGVARPGKTIEDKKNGHVPYKKNRRHYDDKEKQWVKV